MPTVSEVIGSYYSFCSHYISEVNLVLGELQREALSQREEWQELHAGLFAVRAVIGGLGDSVSHRGITRVQKETVLFSLSEVFIEENMSELLAKIALEVASERKRKKQVLLGGILEFLNKLTSYIVGLPVFSPPPLVPLPPLPFPMPLVFERIVEEKVPRSFERITLVPLPAAASGALASEFDKDVGEVRSPAGRIILAPLAAASGAPVSESEAKGEGGRDSGRHPVAKRGEPALFSLGADARERGHSPRRDGIRRERGRSGQRERGWERRRRREGLIDHDAAAGYDGRQLLI